MRTFMDYWQEAILKHNSRCNKEKPMKKPFDPTKPVQTRDGRKARILATDKTGGQPIIALVQDPLSRCCQPHEIAESFCSDGRYFPYGTDESSKDLVNIPQKIVQWINIYKKTGVGCAHATREEADNIAMIDRVACIRIEVEEGEGL